MNKYQEKALNEIKDRVLIGIYSENDYTVKINEINGVLIIIAVMDNGKHRRSLVAQIGVRGKITILD